MTGLAAARLPGRRALVTGAGAGIGRACTERFVAEGARVAALDRDGDSVRALADRLGSAVRPIECDIADEAGVARAFELIRDAFGGLDAAVLGAGVQLPTDAAVHELSLAAWQQTLAINLTGLFLTARAAVSGLLDAGGGSIVVIGSPTGIYGMELGRHAYSASKGGGHGLARVMSTEYAGQGVRVNVVLPGLVDTALNADLLGDEYASRDVLASIPLGRAGAPSEVAGLVAWLASDDASYATGGLFTIDGGMTAL